MFSYVRAAFTKAALLLIFLATGTIGLTHN
jgi:hypothetical protein